MLFLEGNEEGIFNPTKITDPVFETEIKPIGFISIGRRKDKG